MKTLILLTAEMLVVRNIRAVDADHAERRDGQHLDPRWRCAMRWMTGLRSRYGLGRAIRNRLAHEYSDTPELRWAALEAALHAAQRLLDTVDAWLARLEPSAVPGP